MMMADEPTDEHVRTSYKLQRRVHSLRRYAWNARDILQELRQVRAVQPLPPRRHGRQESSPADQNPTPVLSAGQPTPPLHVDGWRGV